MEFKCPLARTVDSKKLKYGPGKIFAGFPCSLGLAAVQSSTQLPLTTRTVVPAGSY